MNILFFESNCFTQLDIRDVFRRSNINYNTISYHFNNLNKDIFFEERFPTYLKGASYDAVFSINYFPLVAKACYDNNIKYLAWSYDNLLIETIEPTLGLPTNYLFLFERSQVTYFQEKGFDNVFHLPLGINTHRLSNIIITPEDEKVYSTDISFIGDLYDQSINKILTQLNDFEQGYLTSIMDIQLKLYGSYILDTLLSPGLFATISSQCQDIFTKGTPSKDHFTCEMARFITHTERLQILELLSNHHNVNLYTSITHDTLSKVNFKGTTSYYSSMPKIFYCSKINLNITFKRLQSGIPLRALDILGSGGLLLTNYQEELFEYFTNEKDIMVYESIEDSLEKANFLLKHENIRLRIATNGFLKAKEYFSYEKQFATLFKIANL